jgi:hypothetical protein
MRSVCTNVGCQRTPEAPFSLRNRDSEDRGGFTLMEMIVVITAMAAVSVTGALLVGLLMSAETQGARAIVKQQTLSRLGRQLRSDAHDATAVEVADTPAQPAGVLVLTLPDGSETRWTADNAAIVREVTSAAAVSQRESYELQDGTTRFQYDESAGLIELVHESRADPLTDTYSAQAPPGVTRVRRMQAAVGVNRRNPIEEPMN